ncbi:MAG: glycosyltransferase family A protein, partial [Colwellia sp.]
MQVIKDITKNPDTPEPILSIVIPVYNASEYIAETLDSAISQTYKSIEIICVDDCSTDNSAEIITNYIKKYSQIKYVKNNENMGACVTRNKGIEIAKGEFILPFDADDMIANTYCEKAMNTFREKPQTSVIYCKAEFFNEKGKWDWLLPKYNARRMLFRNLVFSCAFFRKSDWEKFGGYNSNMIHGFQDWDFWLNFVENNLEFHQLPEILFFYRRQESVNPSISAGLKNK